MLSSLQPRCLIRYGVMGHVGTFALDPDIATVPRRGQTVVIRSDRGLELGEILLLLDEPEDSPHPPGEAAGDDAPRVLRAAADDDLERLRGAEQLRETLLARYSRVLAEHKSPLELIDVEPLLGADVVVLHCLGPSDVELSLLTARFRSECDVDVRFELLGSELGAAFGAGGSPAPTDEGRGRCGDCGRSGGGCSTGPESGSGSERPGERVDPSHAGGSCGSGTDRGCGSCGVSKWLAARNR